MSRIIDFTTESFKIFDISNNIFMSSSLNDNFLTINSFKTNNNDKSKIFSLKKRKTLPLMELEKIVHTYFNNLYYHDKYFYNIKVINEIINNCDSHLVAEFKDYLIMGDESEFLQRKYKLSESKKFIPILCNYYKSCSIIFPNYVILHENKYLFKNIRKKQKVIDHQQEQEDKRIKNKKRENRNEDNNIFFTTKAWNSILNQTNTSNLKMFFGIKHNDKEEESVSIIFKNIVKAEKKALLVSKKNNIKNNNLKNILNKLKNDGSQSKINHILKNKSFKGKKQISNNHSKYSLKNKNHENEKGKYNMNSNRNIINNNNNIEKSNNNDFDKENNNLNSKINILYSNINNLNKQIKIVKKEYIPKHEKSNTCIFETDSNIVYQKKIPASNAGNSTNRQIVKINNSNRRIIKVKNKNSKDKKTNRGIITKILSKIKNQKNLVIQGNNSYNNINIKRSILNMKRYHNPSSISLHNKTNSSIKRKNNSKLNININESNSTPNMYNMKNNKSIKYKKLKEKKEKKEKSQFQLLNFKNFGNVSPLKKMLIKNNSHKLRNNHIHHKSKTSKNKNKKVEKERQKLNLNAYKITPYNNTQRYITTNSFKNDCSN